MKKNIINAAPTLGTIAVVTALVLSFRIPANAESMIGYASVLAILGLVALEYRISWKRLFGRN